MSPVVVKEGVRILFEQPGENFSNSDVKDFSYFFKFSENAYILLSQGIPGGVLRLGPVIKPKDLKDILRYNDQRTRMVEPICGRQKSPFHFDFQGHQGHFKTKRK